jgi:hypothetical protein
MLTESEPGTGLSALRMTIPTQDLFFGDSISIPTARTSFLIHFTGLAKTARQQKAALTAGQRRRASKTSWHGWQADPIIRWKWRECNVRGFPCCSGLKYSETFSRFLTERAHSAWLRA